MTAKLDAIGLVVADLKTSVTFYRLLSLDFGDIVDAEGHGHAEADLGAGMRLMLDTVEGIKEFDPAYTPAHGDPRASLAFRCQSPAAVDQLFARLTLAGARAHKAPWDAFWGQRYAQLRDPDGNGVDLYAELDKP
jgi:catechol 2,3-dioxygenase-like lactoylglutathione lyase family enzyme